MLIKDVLRIPPERQSAGDYGVELEIEGECLPDDLNSRKWRIDQDGSLKADEAFEYVMPKPLDLAGVRSSLNYIKEAFKVEEATIYNSVRAGTHVHVNVQDMSMTELFTFISLYFTVEDLLVKTCCGESREGNLFCLRAKDAEYVLFQLKEAIQSKDLWMLDSSMLRYCSLNVCSLFKYGSVEFRAMRGTQNFDDVMQWVEVLDELKNSSKLFHNPESIIYSMSGDGEDAFLRRIFPTKHELFTGNPEFRRMIRQGVRRVQIMAFATDWNEFDRPNKNPFPKFRNRDEEF